MGEVSTCCRSYMVLFPLNSNKCPMSAHYCMCRTAQDESRSIVLLAEVCLGKYLRCHVINDWFSAIWRAVPRCYLAIHSAVLFCFLLNVYSSYVSKLLLSYLWSPKAAACKSLCHSLWVPGGVIRWRCSMQRSAVTLPESLAKQSHGKLQVGLSNTSSLKERCDLCCMWKLDGALHRQKNYLTADGCPPLQGRLQPLH